MSLTQVAYSPNDEVLASAGYDQAVKVWDCRSRSWEPIQTMRVFADSVTSVTVTEQCAAARHLPTLRLLDFLLTSPQADGHPVAENHAWYLARANNLAQRST